MLRLRTRAAQGRDIPSEEAMSMRTVLALLACVALGCSDDKRSCAQLGWSCGLDDNGTSCGACTAGVSCNNGRCGPTCSVPAFGACVIGGPSCCPTSNGGATLCTVIGPGRRYCEPVCTTDAYCDSVSGTSGQFTCNYRDSTVRVCGP